MFAFEDNDVIIPLVVLEELDRHKSRMDDVGRNARQVSRTLDEMRTSGFSLQKGVPLTGGGTLSVAMIGNELNSRLPTDLLSNKVDNLIIAFMQTFEPDCGLEAILVSKDINVRIKCDSMGIKCDDYLKMRIAHDPQSFYRGVTTIEVPLSVVEQFYGNKTIAVESDVLFETRLFPNQIVILKYVAEGQPSSSAITRYVKSANALLPLEESKSAFGLKPRNKEQTFALELLFDNDVKLVTLGGPAGCGKTCVTLAAALEQVKGIGTSSRAVYDRLIVTKPVQPMGKDIGFLPGTLNEKMDPWIAPIKDNLNFLFGSKRPPQKVRKQSSKDFNGEKPSHDEGTYLSLLQEKGLIEVEALTYIRGRSIPNSFVIVDECQNLSTHEIKTIITRVGEGSKVVLIGDITQIDNVHVDIYTNGLTYVAERFKEQQIAGHVSLIKGERSTLATLAAQIL
jgi:PhoH-like ATPase